jgi:dienelactone hydrolase
MGERARPCLPPPTGPHPVGTTPLHLTDTSRPDPWVGGHVRELMVSLWYPAASPNGPRAAYLTPTESELLLGSGGVTGVPPDVLSTVGTNSTRDAVPAGRPASLPLVVLSPGFTKPRGILTGLAEDLAGNGYVVAAIDHTYENVATTFPDGRVTTCLARESPRRDPAFWATVTRGRAADVSFVLDELTRPIWPRAALIDRSRIAMAGHSIGGASAIPAMLADPRVRAGVSLDGGTPPSIPETGLSRPFLFLGRRIEGSAGTAVPLRGWERDWPLLTGWRRWLIVAGAAHHSFTDIGPLTDQLGLRARTGLPSGRAHEITRSHVRAFVEQHLRGRPQPLPHQASTCYPEVKSWSPEPIVAGISQAPVLRSAPGPPP